MHHHAKLLAHGFVLNNARFSSLLQRYWRMLCACSHAHMYIYVYLESLLDQEKDKHTHIHIYVPIMSEQYCISELKL
jgi:hypothetical protein